MKKLFLVLTLLIASTLQSFATTPGTLAVDTQIPLVMDGKTVGSMTLKAGSEVSITQVLPTEDSVLISRGDSTPVKVSKAAITPESLQNAIAAETAAAATPTPVPAPTSSSVAVATPQPSQTPKVKLTEEEFVKKTISLIKNGDGDGQTLQSYYYNPFANDNPKDITFRLRDIKEFCLDDNLYSFFGYRRTGRPIVLSPAEITADASNNTDTWTLSVTNHDNFGRTDTYLLLSPKEAGSACTPVFVLFDNLSQEKLQKLEASNPMTMINGETAKFLGWTKLHKKDKNGTLQESNGLFCLKKDNQRGILVGCQLPLLSFTPEVLAAALSNQHRPK